MAELAMTNGKGASGSATKKAARKCAAKAKGKSNGGAQQGRSAPASGGWPQELKLLAAVLGIYTCYLTSGMLQEHIYSYKEERFTATIFLLWVQCVVNVIFAGVTMRVSGRSGEKIPHGLFCTAGCAYIGAMVCSIEALKYVNFPTKELGKSCKMIPVMLFGVLFARKKYSFREYLCVALITMGIVVFNLSGRHKEGKDNTAYGLVLLSLSLMLDGVTGSTQERLKARCKPTVHEMMFFMNAWALGLLTLTAGFSGQGVEGVAFCMRHPTILLDILGFALAATVGQNFIYFTISAFNPLVCTTITTTRKFFTILFSVIVYGHSINVKQWGGVALVFAGLGGEMLGKYHKGKANKAKATPVKLP